MAIVFKKVRWKNLMSTGNDFIELNLDSPGTTLIVGENGAGKCVRKSTSIEVTFDDPDIQKKYNDYLKNK